ncbi:MAG: cache domain-containing protein, partial [Gammaproteobacteria bacterium]|nr:cache domain-containing protein [Gammaproteobacteria bacterium]
MAGLLIGILRWSAYENVQQDELEKLSYQITLAEKGVYGLVRGINVVLEEISQALNTDDITSAIKLGEHYKKLFPEIRSFTIVDHSGFIRAASIKSLIGGDRSQAAYYKEIKANPDRNMMFLGRPFKDPLGASIMLYNRAIPDASGKLKWIAIASIDLTFYDRLLESLINRDTQSVILIHGDGLILSHSSDYEGLRLKTIS